MKIELLETAGWYTVFKNLRQSYSLDSRSKLENEWTWGYDDNDINGNIINNPRMVIFNTNIIGQKDLQLLSTLVKKGDSHSKIIRGLQTYVEITAPRYWWQEWITYVIGVLEINPTIDWISLNSESTMHTLKQKYNNTNYTSNVHNSIKDKFEFIYKEELLTNDNKGLDIIKANLPEGYLQTRTYQVSYQAWRRIYQQRANHKLEEWNTNIVKFIEGLPFAKELITINLNGAERIDGTIL